MSLDDSDATVVVGNVPLGGANAEAAPQIQYLGLIAYEEAGGHTLEKHVGRSPGYLKKRIRTEALAFASTFLDRDTAEAALAACFAERADELAAWAESASLEYEMLYEHTETVGIVVTRTTGSQFHVHDSRLVSVHLRAEQKPGFIILTAYPTLDVW